MVEQAAKIPPPSPGAPEYLEQAMSWSDEVRAKSRVALDLPYGDEERQRLDIYMPDDESHPPAPVLLFLHGGYWVIGHKDLMGFMAPALTPAPALLVSVGYRLAPGAKYPQQVDDCRSALSWVYQNIARYGGDPGRIYVGGHSAGGHLAAILTLAAGTTDGPRPAVRCDQGLLPGERRVRRVRYRPGPAGGFSAVGGRYSRRQSDVQHRGQHHALPAGDRERGL